MTFKSFEVRQIGDHAIQVHIRTDDEATSLLWAAHWFDQHREYAVKSITLERPDHRDEDDSTTILVVTASEYNERSPREFGPCEPPLPV